MACYNFVNINNYFSAEKAACLLVTNKIQIRRLLKGEAIRDHP